MGNKNAIERVSERRAAAQRPRKTRRRLASFAIKLGLLLVVLVVMVVAGGLLLVKMRDFEGPTTVIVGGDTTTVEPNAGLSAAERTYLRGYLMLRAADIEQPAGTDATPISFTVDPGENAVDIAERLEEANLIADATLFRYYLRYYDLDAGLEAGDFSLQQTMTIPQIAQSLSHALANEIEIRITEGWRLEQVGDMLAEHPDYGIDANEFLLLARRSPAPAGDGGTSSSDDAGGVESYEFMAELPAGASLEGYLFPDTYRLPADATAADLVNSLLYTFSQRVTPEIRQALAEQGLSLHGAITLASIVEREAQLAEERPIIASVFLNRVAQGIKLDADPTVQYALGYQESTGDWWKRPLLYEDLEFDSPYNTYRYPGLPPGPIASPGLASIQAVAYPAETDYLYFVVDCTAETPGAHVFSTTFEEHQANVARCQ